jgi:hypothetical protein
MCVRDVANEIAMIEEGCWCIAPYPVREEGEGMAGKQTRFEHSPDANGAAAMWNGSKAPGKRTLVESTHPVQAKRRAGRATQPAGADSVDLDAFDFFVETVIYYGACVRSDSTPMRQEQGDAELTSRRRTDGGRRPDDQRTKPGERVRSAAAVRPVGARCIEAV